jgi:hypothetical protein
MRVSLNSALCSVNDNEPTLLFYLLDIWSSGFCGYTDEGTRGLASEASQRDDGKSSETPGCGAGYTSRDAPRQH